MQRKRKRWGFVISASRRDQTIARWLDEVANDPDINVSELVKNYLYSVATGEAPASAGPAPDPEISQRLDEIRSMLRRLAANGLASAPVAEPAPADDAADVERRLGGIDD